MGINLYTSDQIYQVLLNSYSQTLKALQGLRGSFEELTSEQEELLLETVENIQRGLLNNIINVLDLDKRIPKGEF